MILQDIAVGAIFCSFGFMLVILNRNRDTPLARGQVWIGRGMIAAGLLLPLIMWLFAKT